MTFNVSQKRIPPRTLEENLQPEAIILLNIDPTQIQDATSAMVTPPLEAIGADRLEFALAMAGKPLRFGLPSFWGISDERKCDLSSTENQIVMTGGHINRKRALLEEPK